MSEPQVLRPTIPWGELGPVISAYVRAGWRITRLTTVLADDGSEELRILTEREAKR